MSSNATTPLSAARFQARVGLLAVVGLIYASACGGPFGTEEYVASTGPGLLILLLCLAPFLWGVPMAFATAELSAARPVEGGYYVWAREFLGPFWGFLAGTWSLVSSFLDMALYPVLFAEALRFLSPGMGPVAKWLAAVAFIAVLTWLNYRGIRIVGGAALGLNLFLVAPLVWLTIAGLLQARHNPFVPFALPGTGFWAGLNGGLALAIWFYSGYVEVSTAAEEIADPRRTIPRALLIVTPLVVLSYALPTVAGLAAAGNWEGWTSGEFARVGMLVGGPVLGHWMFLASVASFTVIFLAYVLWWSRLGWALAADRVLPGFLARLHPRRGTPYRVLWLYAAGYSLLALLPFQQLLVLDVWVFGAYDLLLLASVVRARRVLRDRPAGFRIPGGTAGVWINLIVPLVSWVVVLATTERENITGGIAVILVGPFLYAVRAIWSRFRSRPAAPA
jgi:amino acid transporter